MRITRIIWLHDVVEKLAWKHNVSTDEVEEMLRNRPRFRLINRTAAGIFDEIPERAEI